MGIVTLRVKEGLFEVGCGGNGSAVAVDLRYLHQALLVYGHPAGLRVTLLDPDVISPMNCVRQPFSRSEIGLNKSVVLANRPNLFWSLDWEFWSGSIQKEITGMDILIVCVDPKHWQRLRRCCRKIAVSYPIAEPPSP